MNEPTGTEAALCELIAARQRLGVAKYGTTVAQNHLELRAWLQHALEECLDQAIYLKRAIEELDAKAADLRCDFCGWECRGDEEGLEDDDPCSVCEESSMAAFDDIGTMRAIVKGGAS